MGKRRGQGNQSQSAITGKRSRPTRKKTLYLALADWADGLSIYKIDTSSLESGDGQGCSHSLRCCSHGFRRLPEPVARIAVPVIAQGTLFAPMGTKLFIAAARTDERYRRSLALTDESCEQSPAAGTDDDNESYEQSPTFVYDTEMAALSIGPRLPARIDPRTVAVTVAIGETVYVLSVYCRGDAYCGGDDDEPEYSFEVMSLAPMGWSWKSLPSPPFSTQEFVTSYALHPDERNIFMTIRDIRFEPKNCTYSFDTKRCLWRCHGEWALPFEGRGLFDSELDAWVGLHPDGYICSCQVASRSATSTNPLQPDCVIGDEKLFKKDQSRRSAATLTSLGKNKFCLIEFVECEAANLHLASDKDSCLLFLNIFSLNYNKGKLQSTINHRTHSYFMKKVKLQATIHHHTHAYVTDQRLFSFPPKAFWM